MLDQTSFDITIPIPAIIGHFGDALQTFVMQIKANQIRMLLGHDPRPDHWKNLNPPPLRELYEYLQRKTQRRRRVAMQNYVVNRIGPEAICIGALPAICVGVTKPVTFVPHSEEHPNMGVLKMCMSESEHRVLLDGLARYCGAADLADQNMPVGEWFTFPVTLYAPSEKQGELTYRELGQLFHDFNFLQQTVSTAHAQALDYADPYIITANKLGGTEIVQKHGGMEQRSMTLGKKSTALTTQNLLIRFVFAATEGSLYRKANSDSGATNKFKPDAIADTIMGLDLFVNALADSMGDNFGRRGHLHLTSQGWQALGMIYHDMHTTLNGQLTADAEASIVAKIAAIDWSRENAAWFDFFLVREENAAGEEVVKVQRGGSHLVHKLRDYIRASTGLDALLDTHAAEAAA
jgi:DndB-like DNA-sulfur modification-associated protein